MRPLYFILFVVSFLTTSCKTVDVIKRIQADEAELVQFSSNEKNVVFIPMHHVGKKEFYDHVREIVTGLKQTGYLVYYEGSIMEPSMDSVSQDIYLRKFRKMMGAHYDSSGYAKLLHEKGLFKNLVDQPPYDSLGLDKLDKKVDLYQNELIDAYEKAFGEIILSEEDSAIALGEKYPIALRLPQKNMFHIIVDHRNTYLAQQIQNSPDKRILVIYGALHVDGTYGELKKMDGSWKKKK